MAWFCSPPQPAPELFTGFGATALAALPDIALSCVPNLRGGRTRRGIRRQPVHRHHNVVAGNVVSLSAVRIGALDLGIGNVLGSNLFNLMFSDWTMSSTAYSAFHGCVIGPSKSTWRGPDQFGRSRGVTSAQHVHLAGPLTKLIETVRPGHPVERRGR
jgi:hypothetical protein